MGTSPPRMRKGLICLSLQQKDQRYSGYSASKLVYRDGKQNRVPAIQEKVVSNLLCHLDITSLWGQMGSNLYCESIEGAGGRAHPFTHPQSWLTWEVPDYWKIGSVTPTNKNSWKENPGNYRLVSLTSVPGKVME